MTVLVYANRLRKPTGMIVKKGEKYRIASRGTWRWYENPSSCGAERWSYSQPGLVVPNAPLAALVGFVKDKGFLIGGEDEFIPPESGPLYLTLNDLPTAYDDNSGYLEVTIW